MVGSSLIGQNFTDAKYFWPRPSATSAADPNDPTKTVSAPYNAAASSGSNKGPTSRDLMERIAPQVRERRSGSGAKPTWPLDEGPPGLGRDRDR